jgi:hypothetical protein
MFGAKLMYHAHASMYASPEFRAFSQLTGNGRCKVLRGRLILGLS